MTSASSNGLKPVRNAPAIRLQNVSLTLGQNAIYSDLSLELPAGRVTCLLGPSGVGKSSLLKHIAGLVDGRGNISAIWDDRQAALPPVSFMGQTDLLAPWLTVLKNVTLGTRLRGEKPENNRAMEMLRRVGLQDVAQQRPDTLSGGMRQRVALARALMEANNIVLMDEPFSAVDALTRRRLQDLTADVLSGCTILLVTHDPWEAVRIGDQIIVMSGPHKSDLHHLPVSGLSIPRDEHAPASVALHNQLLSHLMATGGET